ITTYLGTARAELSLAATSSVNSASGKGWLNDMLNVVELISGLNWAIATPIQPLVTIAAYTTEFVIKESMNGQTSTSTANIKFQNDGLNAAYSVIVDSVTKNYANLNLVAGNQAEAICGDYGKLTAFFQIVYPKSPPVSSSEIGQNIGALNDFHEYLSYEWLFPAKYQICTQVVDYHNPNNNCLATGVTGLYSKALGTEPGRTQTCYQGMCQTSTFNCNVYAYFWICDKSNHHYAAPASVLGPLSANKYAIQKGLVKYNNFGSTLYEDCINSFRGGVCNSAGMALPIAKAGDCVENWSDARDVTSCDAPSY
ncbi:MAG: hypothetical protein SGILL_005591, partial [Bacillariaceae sp.]